MPVSRRARHSHPQKRPTHWLAYTMSALLVIALVAAFFTGFPGEEENSQTEYRQLQKIQMPQGNSVWNAFR